MTTATKEFYVNRIGVLEAELDKLGKELIFTVDGLESKIKELQNIIKEQRLRISSLEMGIDNLRGKVILYEPPC